MDKQRIADILPKPLLPLARRVYCYYQKYFTIFSTFFRSGQYTFIKKKKRILVYGVSALGFGGTEKNLQIIAKFLDKEIYDVYFMYGKNPRKLGNYTEDAIRERGEYVRGGGDIIFIPFEYGAMEDTLPYFLTNMSPHISQAIEFYGIDLVITAGAGNSEFPLTSIKRPILFLNIFGIPNLIENIKYHLCISHAVGNLIADIVPRKKIKTFYVPSEGPLPSSEERGMRLRKDLGFTHSDIVFGRIGRADDSIFDPIGILAFEKAVQENTHLHYLIVSPAPKLVKLVEEKNIPNVHFLPSIYSEEEVWAFHAAIDIFAHFRYDGESCGLSIAESMLSGNPVISHRSRIWNAHGEYLNKENSFVADIDSVDQYYAAMMFFARDTEGVHRKKMGNHARKTAEELFLIRPYMDRLTHLIEKI